MGHFLGWNQLLFYTGAVVTHFVSAKPPFYDELLTLPKAVNFVGMIEKEWSESWADNFSTADYIAVIDSDVVFTSFVLPSLLFEPGPHGLRPIVMGHSAHEVFPATVLALRLVWVAEFMDNFPLVIHRQHFASLRRVLVMLYGAHESDDFDSVFVPYLKGVWEESSKSLAKLPECICFHSMMGSFLYHRYKEFYAWSIRHGHVKSLPAEHCCPRLRVAHHVPYWGMENWMARWGYHYKQLKFAIAWKSPASVGDLAYRQRSAALMFAGLCAVRWAQGNTSLARGRDRLVAINSSWRITDVGMLDAQHDLCVQGLALLEGRGTWEDRK
ncbi:unnamed protein product [Symbiodinium natans]|uniref:Uncharacterized protein n=1 Tax=Symbiodinium natans TaxID=878477 RepID=A0A812T5Q0_9DINO|nr:unnamed protein product [Symbiodinium natans]